MKATRYDPQVELPELPDYSCMPDEVLFDCIRRQDLVACGVYYVRHGAVIYGRLLALLGDEATARRALEELFLEMWRRRRELARLGPLATEALMDRATQFALSILRDSPEPATADNDDRNVLVQRRRALDKPDVSDEVIHRCVEALLARAEPVVPPPEVRRRLSLRLGHPDVEKGARRYARRWPRQVMLIALFGLGLAALLVWLILRAGV